MGPFFFHRTAFIINGESREKQFLVLNVNRKRKKKDFVQSQRAARGLTNRGASEAVKDTGKPK